MSFSQAPGPRAFPAKSDPSLYLPQSRLWPHGPLTSHQPSQPHPDTLRGAAPAGPGGVVLTKAEMKGVFVEHLLCADQRVQLQTEFSRKP